MKSGIYKILNRITEKFYIGSAVNLKARWTQHKGKLRLQIHPNKYLQASWNLHGEEAFEFIVLEECSKTDLPTKEQNWLDNTQCYDRNIGYNLYKVAGSPLGYKWTEERKAEASARMTGYKHTDEAKAKMKEAQKSRGSDWNNKISASKMGHFVSEETKNKIRIANTHLVSEEIRAKQRASVSKPDKWPHGFICKCRECLDKKNAINRGYRKNKQQEISCEI